MRRSVQQQQQQHQQQRLRVSALCSLACVKAIALPALLLFTVVMVFNRHFQLIASPFSKHTTSSLLVSVPSPAPLTPHPTSSGYRESRLEQNVEAGGYNQAVDVNNGGLVKNSSFDFIQGQPEEPGSAAQARSNGQLNGQRKQRKQEPEWDSEGYVSASTLGQLAQEASINGTVVILVCSYGYADFLLNWAVYAGELGYGRNFLVFAEDRESFDLLRERFPRQVVRWHVQEIEQAGEEELKAAGLVEESDSASGGSAGSSGTGSNGVGDGGGNGISSSSSGSSSKEAFSFLTLGFKKLMYRRVAYIRTLLNMGFNVLICDSDFIWVKDPFPYLFARPSHSELLRRSMASRLALTSTLGVYNNKRKRYAVSDSDLHALPSSEAAPIEYDVVGVREFPDTYNFYAASTYLMDPRPAQLDHAKLCGGFVLFRNTPGGRLLLEMLILKIYRAPKVTGRENDQLYLGMAIHELLNISPAPLVGVLPQTLFPPGWLYFPESSSMPPGRIRVLPSRDDVVTIHNNWMSGKENKLARFKMAGLWRILDY